MTQFLSFFFSKWRRTSLVVQWLRLHLRCRGCEFGIPKGEAKRHICLGGKNQTVKQKQCNRFSKDYKDGHIKKDLKKQQQLSSICCRYTPHLYSFIHLQALSIFLLCNAINIWMHISLNSCFYVAKWNSWIIHCFSLNFCRMSALFFIVAAPVCIPASSVGGLSLTTLVFSAFLIIAILVRW